MASISSASNSTSSYGAKALCRLVGVTCLAGFLLSVLILALPPSVRAIEWRVTFLQQVGDRSIILLFGIALSLYGFSESRRGMKQLALASLMIGIVFHLVCILLLRDTLILQRGAIENINSQANQVQTRLQEAQNNPDLQAQITPEQIQQATQALATQAETLRQNAKTSIIKAGLASVGNFVVVGLALIGLGRYGMRLR